jgi:hypothetical protein
MPKIEDISSLPAYLEKYKDVFDLEKVQRLPKFYPRLLCMSNYSMELPSLSIFQD